MLRTVREEEIAVGKPFASLQRSREPGLEFLQRTPGGKSRSIRLSRANVDDAHAKISEARDARSCFRNVIRREVILYGDDRNGLRETAQHFQLVALDIDLAVERCAELRDRHVESEDRDVNLCDRDTAPVRDETRERTTRPDEQCSNRWCAAHR